MTKYLNCDAAFMLQGPAGELEVVVDSPLQGVEPQGAVLICHPHPQFGGTLTNKVAHTLARAAKAQGFYAVRFNFRGVGKSSGDFDGAVGEVDDAHAVFNWLREGAPGLSIWVTGFSFGAYVAGALMQRLNVDVLNSVAGSIMVAPPTMYAGVSKWREILWPTWVVVAEQDEVIELQETMDWFELQSDCCQLLSFPGASHFFHGQLSELKLAVEQVLTQ